MLYIVALSLSLLSSMLCAQTELREGALIGPVSNDIYGVNDQVSFEVSRNPSYPILRWGGNHTSRYNFKINSSNHAADWYFMNIPYDFDKGRSKVDALIDEQIAKKSKLLITIPMSSFVTGKREYRWSYSVKEFGPQESVESERSRGDAGNGVKKNGEKLKKTKTSLTSLRIDESFVKDWVKHIKARVKGRMDLYFALDNEPMLWHETHRDLRFSDSSIKSPKMSYDELWQRTKDYALAIKSVAPEAKIFGPVAWGWCSYFYSAKDGCKISTDRLSHANTPLLEWYLKKTCEYKKKTGLRLVDYLDIHYYPQTAFSSSDESKKAATARLSAVKELYDPSYRSKSWISDEITLIPRMQKIIKDSCPETKLAITEYRFGTASNGRSTFLANAEAMSIFAKYQLDLATMWSTVKEASLTEATFNLYLNYDSKGANALNSSAYQVLKSKGKTHLDAYMLKSKTKKLVYIFNKEDKRETVSVSFKNQCRKHRLFTLDYKTRKIIEIKSRLKETQLKFIAEPMSVYISECS